jgi:hypothetical protein
VRRVSDAAFIVHQNDSLEIFAEATAKISKVGDGNDFYAVGAHIALDPARGGMLSEVRSPLLQVGSIVRSTGNL